MGNSSISYLGPAFLICVGYMDPGKWVTALEGGSRFGLELLWVSTASIVFAALLQSLSSRLGLVTGKNLAQVCHDEYPRYLCALLWFQCEVSVVILDLTMTLGIAIGLNALLGLSMVASVVLSAFDTLVFLVALPHLGMHNAEIFSISIMGVVLLCFVVEALHNNAATSTILNGMLPRLKGETLYVAAGIIGANIMPSNFYLQSALVQEEKDANRLSQDFLHHSIVDIATGFSVALLINIAVLSSATAAFHNSGHVVITLQDAQALMGEILSSSVAPAAFGFALLCTGQLSTLVGTVAGQIALEGLVDANASLSLHRVLIKLAAVLPAVFLAWNLGGEGMYQVLLFSQVVLALQLPFALVPLVKVTSSQGVMGRHKNSFIVEMILWVCVISIFIIDIWVIFDMFFGESDEFVGSGSWNLVRDFASEETVRILSRMVVVGVTTLSILLVMWMISAPLKADTAKPCRPFISVEDKSEALEGSPSQNSEATCDTRLTSQNHDLSVNSALEEGGGFRTSEMKDRESPWESIHTPPGHDLAHMTALMSLDISEKEIPEVGQGNNSDLTAPQQVSQKEIGMEEKQDSMACLPLTEKEMPLQECLEEDDLQKTQSQSTFSVDDFSFVDSLSSMKSSSIEGSPSWELAPSESVTGKSATLVAKDHVDREAETLRNADEEVYNELLDKDDYDMDCWEHDEVVQESLSFVGGSVNSLSFEEPGSGKSFSARSDTSEGSCGGSGSGSLSRLSGLGRAARRQFAALLDEFWGKLYDLHGHSVSQTNVKPDRGVTGARASERVNNKGLKETFDHDSAWCSPKRGQKPWQKNMGNDQVGQADAYLPPSYHGSLSTSSRFDAGKAITKHSSLSHELSERRYSSLRYPSRHGDFDSQPATVHGYKISSYTGKSGNIASGLEARPYFLHRPQHLSSHLESDPSSGSVYDASTVTGSNLQIDSVANSSSIRALLSAQLRDELSDMPLGNSFLTDRLPTQADRGFPYGRTSWDSFTERDNATWDPLVYRVTGELDIAHSDTQTRQRNVDSFNFPVGQSPIGQRGYIGHSRNKTNYMKHQTERTPLSFDEISPSQSRKDGFSIRSSPQIQNDSLWSTQPFEQLFGFPSSPTGTHRASGQGGSNLASARDSQTAFTGIDFEIEVLNSLRSCLRKLLRLDGSDWLFRSDSGSDEDLIGMVGTRERVLLEADTRELHKSYTNSQQVWSASAPQRPFPTVLTNCNDLVSSTLGTSGVPHCGEGCVWSMELVVSFGVWCIHRVLELAYMESRPELWGKYTYVLNRLQGVLEPAFSKPRSVPTSCICVMSEASDWQGRCLSRQGSLKDSGTVDLPSGSLSNGFMGNSYLGYPQSWPWGRNTSTCKGKGASSSIFLEIIKEVETAIGSRKGRTGTAAGDVAFPKGKENLASVLKRYKRRLAIRTSGTAAGTTGNTGNRRSSALAPSLFLQHLYFLLF